MTGKSGVYHILTLTARNRSIVFLFFRYQKWENLSETDAFPLEQSVGKTMEISLVEAIRAIMCSKFKILKHKNRVTELKSFPLHNYNGCGRFEVYFFFRVEKCCDRRKSPNSATFIRNILWSSLHRRYLKQYRQKLSVITILQSEPCKSHPVAYCVWMERCQRS